MNAAFRILAVLLLSLPPIACGRHEGHPWPSRLTARPYDLGCAQWFQGPVVQRLNQAHRRAETDRRLSHIQALLIHQARDLGLPELRFERFPDHRGASRHLLRPVQRLLERGVWHDKVELVRPMDQTQWPMAITLGGPDYEDLSRPWMVLNAEALESSWTDFNGDLQKTVALLLLIEVGTQDLGGKDKVVHVKSDIALEYLVRRAIAKEDESLSLYVLETNYFEPPNFKVGARIHRWLAFIVHGRLNNYRFVRANLMALKAMADYQGQSLPEARASR